MARRSLNTVRKNFIRNLNDSRRLAADAYLWSAPANGAGVPLISRQRLESLTELAFLRAFLAWEAFLEESFILYLAGANPPRGRPPRRFAFPPNQQTAMEWVVPEGSRYASWTNAALVIRRSERYFHTGNPFAPVLKSNQSVLEDARILRNAIAHDSISTRQKFETLVRRHLGALPPNTTVGRFLGMTIAGSAPPLSFLESLFSRIEFATGQIVPS